MVLYVHGKQKNKSSELCLKQTIKTNRDMEIVIIINSVLLTITLYFIKDAHKDFKEVIKKVERLDEKVKGISERMPR